MTRDEMCKRSWKGYCLINYKDHGMQLPIECLLVCIDFDAEIMTLMPINDFYEQKDFPANIKYCEIPKRKMKVV